MRRLAGVIRHLPAGQVPAALMNGLAKRVSHRFEVTKALELTPSQVRLGLEVGLQRPAIVFPELDLGVDVVVATLEHNAVDLVHVLGGGTRFRPLQFYPRVGNVYP